jgi:chemotaxis signal transduction protein
VGVGVGVSEPVSVWVLVAPVGVDGFALDIQAVREVLAAPLLTALPTAPDALVGVTNVRGEIVPVFDTAALLGLPPVGAGTHVVVVATLLGPAGLVATGLPERAELGDPAGPAESAAAVGRFHAGRRIVTLLDHDALLAPARTGGWSP